MTVRLVRLTGVAMEPTGEVGGLTQFTVAQGEVEDLDRRVAVARHTDGGVMVLGYDDDARTCVGLLLCPSCAGDLLRALTTLLAEHAPTHTTIQ